MHPGLGMQPRTGIAERVRDGPAVSAPRGPLTTNTRRSPSRSASPGIAVTAAPGRRTTRIGWASYVNSLMSPPG
ncbi:hypothetical protein QF037_008143 [Streptomyces canus]|nr:hypothetical protein [Streptomyces canus]